MTTQPDSSPQVAEAPTDVCSACRDTRANHEHHFESECQDFRTAPVSKPRNPRVLIESPVFTRDDGARCSPAEVERNMRYLRRAALDSLRRDEDPYASCLIYPQVLDDATPEERKRGIEAGLNWGEAAAKVVFYADHGGSDGVRQGLDRHRERGVEVEQRLIGAEPELGPPPAERVNIDTLEKQFAHEPSHENDYTCARCKQEYFLDDPDDEPTRFCDDCAQHVVESIPELISEIRRLRLAAETRAPRPECTLCKGSGGHPNLVDFCEQCGGNGYEPKESK